MNSASLWIVMTTVASQAQGLEICRTLVLEKLAACGQVLPTMTSVYVWQDQLQQAEEHLVLIKTSAACRAQLEERIQQIHPYDVPELLAFPAAMVSQSYLGWVLASTR